MKQSQRITPEGEVNCEQEIWVTEKIEMQKYICCECGFVVSKWMGNCPECNKWNTFDRGNY